MSSHGERTIKKTQHTCKKQRNIHKAKGFAVIPTDVLQNCFVLDARTRTHNAERRPSGPARTKKRFLSKHVCGGNCKKMSANGEGTNKKTNTHTQKANKHKANDFCSHPDRCAAKWFCVGRRAGAHAHTTHNARRPGPRARAQFWLSAPAAATPKHNLFSKHVCRGDCKTSARKETHNPASEHNQTKNKQT